MAHVAVLAHAPMVHGALVATLAHGALAQNHAVQAAEAEAEAEEIKRHATKEIMVSTILVGGGA